MYLLFEFKYNFFSDTCNSRFLVNITDSGCSLSLLLMSTLQPSSGITCYLASKCTAVQCCLDVQDPLQQTLHFSMDLDLCLQVLEISLEKLVEKKALFSYSYGKLYTRSFVSHCKELIYMG